MHTQSARIIIIGGGPAGLMAAEQITNAGYAVDLYDAMPTVGRKFLLAGIGGLNITHSEPYPLFCQRYTSLNALQHSLDAFKPETLRAWCQTLGIDTFVGTSGRVFPTHMKAAPLLRSWLARLKRHGLRIHARHKWLGWDEHTKQLRFSTPEGEITQSYDALVLALGGGSWKKLGSDGAWMPLLQAHQIECSPLQPSNCGFLCDWSDLLRAKFAGHPLKGITLTLAHSAQPHETRKGECIITERGLEGSLIYAFSTHIRQQIEQHSSATIHIDLLPDHSHAQLQMLLAQKPKHKTLSTYLKTRLKLDTTKVALLFECTTKQQLHDTQYLTQHLKALPVKLTHPTPIDEAISTAGGIKFTELTPHFQLTKYPNIFCAGEMLDWEAPTGGYLLTACFATGKQAGLGVIKHLEFHTKQA